jgi:hypothetical protein
MHPTIVAVDLSFERKFGTHAATVGSFTAENPRVIVMLIPHLANRDKLISRLAAR